MRLLFDQNLPPGLVDRLSDVFPESQHVRSVGLREGADDLIWSFAQAQGYMIVTKDRDFHKMSRVRGAPPKVVWLRLGNCSVQHIERVLRTHADDLTAFGAEAGSAILIIE